MVETASSVAVRAPTTLPGIKRLAKKIKKAHEVKHHVALDRSARLAGYENYAHAQRVLS